MVPSSSRIGASPLRHRLDEELDEEEEGLGVGDEPLEPGEPEEDAGVALTELEDEPETEPDGSMGEGEDEELPEPPETGTDDEEELPDPPAGFAEELDGEGLQFGGGQEVDPAGGKGFTEPDPQY